MKLFTISYWRNNDAHCYAACYKYHELVDCCKHRMRRHEKSHTAKQWFSLFGLFVILLIKLLNALLLLLLFARKLTIVTLFYSIYLLLKSIGFNLSCGGDVEWTKPILNSAARAVTKTTKFHHITPILKSLHWLKSKWENQIQVLTLTYKSLKTGLLTSALLFHSLHIVLYSVFIYYHP